MGDRGLRRRCEQIVNRLDLPEPFDIRELCRRIAAQRQRPIHLLDMRLPASGPCGLWISTGEFDAICYESGTSAAHQELIIGHELGHLLCGHTAAPVIDAEASRLLLPDLDPALVRRVLGRTNYSAAEEREAETMGTLLLRRAGRPLAGPAAPRLDRAAAELYDRLRHNLEDPDR